MLLVLVEPAAVLTTMALSWLESREARVVEKITPAVEAPEEAGKTLKLDQSSLIPCKDYSCGKLLGTLIRVSLSYIYRGTRCVQIQYIVTYRSYVLKFLNNDSYSFALSNVLD